MERFIARELKRAGYRAGIEVPDDAAEGQAPNGDHDRQNGGVHDDNDDDNDNNDNNGDMDERHESGDE